MSSRDEIEKVRRLPDTLAGHAWKVLAVSGDEQSIVPTNAGSGNLRSDGGISMDAGYTPSADQDIATVKHVNTAIAGKRRLAFPGAFLTGYIDGLVVMKTGNTQVKVTAGSAMDSTNLVPLTLTAEATIDIVSPSGNKPYALFLGDDNTCKFSTYFNGADTGYTHQRRIFCVSLQNGNMIVDFTHNGNKVLFSRASLCKLAHTTTVADTADHSVFVFPEMLEEVAYGAAYTGTLFCGDSTKNVEASLCFSDKHSLADTNPEAWGHQAYSQVSFLPFSADRKFWSTTAHSTLTWILFRGYKFKR